MIKRIIKFFKNVRIKQKCTHEYSVYSYSDVICRKCGRIHYDPNLSSRLLNEYSDKMVEGGAWDRVEVETIKRMRGL